MEEIKQILEELEDIHFRHYMVESMVAWWDCQIISYGFVSIGGLIDWLINMSIIDPMEIKPMYHKFGFADGIIETDFEPVKTISGVWAFKFNFKKVTFDLL